MRMKSLLPAILLLLLAAGSAAAQTYPLELEFGYRFLDLSGNMAQLDFNGRLRLGLRAIG